MFLYPCDNNQLPNGNQHSREPFPHLFHDRNVERSIIVGQSIGDAISSKQPIGKSMKSRIFVREKIINEIEDYTELIQNQILLTLILKRCNSHKVLLYSSHSRSDLIHKCLYIKWLLI